MAHYHTDSSDDEGYELIDNCIRGREFTTYYYILFLAFCVGK